MSSFTRPFCLEPPLPSSEQWQKAIKTTSITYKLADTLSHSAKFNLKDQPEHFPQKETLSTQLDLKSQI